VLAFAFIAAIIITILWFAFHLISHISMKNSESSFNSGHRQDEHTLAPNPKELSQLIKNMPLRKANYEGGTVIFWTNDGQISLAVARANSQSLFKVFLRINRPASELGHKILISNHDAQGISFKLTAESLIFSNNESALYDVDVDSLNGLAKLLKEHSCLINNNLSISMTNAKSLTEWISQVIYVHAHSQERLLIGE
jgi:hypothetical protein